MTIMSDLAKVFGAGPGKPAATRSTGPANKTAADSHSHSVIRKPPVTQKTTLPALPSDSKVVRKFGLLSDLPAYKKILTASDGPVPVGESHMGQIIALETGEKECVLISAEEYLGRGFFLDFKQRLQKAGYKIVAVGTADAGFIIGIYTTEKEASALNADSAIIRDFDRLVAQALAIEASDIHIEKRDRGARVRMRLHGRLCDIAEWPSNDYAMKFARTVHTLADDDSKSTSTFSEAVSESLSVSRKLSDGTRVKLRAQTVVAYPDGGFDIVMRVLRIGATSRVRDLEELGYAPDHINMIDYMLSSPIGAIIVAGVTGSGKSTTLQTMMAKVRQRNPGIKMYSIEDPPEYILHGVTQIPVPRRKSMDSENPFSRTMRDAMRADPDVIMVGEVRDPESSALLTSMVQSGHKVLTTVHAADVFSIVGRLEKLGIDTQTMAARGFVSGLIYQSLVPLLCRNCKVPYSPDMAISVPGIHQRIAALLRRVPDARIFLAGKGCECCKNMGVVGRTVCAEMVIPDTEMLRRLRDGGVNEAQEYWRNYKSRELSMHETVSMKGMTALDHAIMKMCRGEVSPVDVEDSLGLLTGYDVTDFSGNLLGE